MAIKTYTRTHTPAADYAEGGALHGFDRDGEVDHHSSRAKALYAALGALPDDEELVLGTLPDGRWALVGLDVAGHRFSVEQRTYLLREDSGGGVVSNLAELIVAARAHGLEVRDELYRHEAAGVGPYQATAVGPECRTLTVVYSGAVRFEAVAGSREPRMPPADAEIRALGDELLAACRREGVGLWFGSSKIGVGCLVQFSPPVASAASRLAEEIRVTRARVLEWPGCGHEERLEELMHDAIGATRTPS